MLLALNLALVFVLLMLFGTLVFAFPALLFKLVLAFLLLALAFFAPVAALGPVILAEGSAIVTPDVAFLSSLLLEGLLLGATLQELGLEFLALLPAVGLALAPQVSPPLPAVGSARLSSFLATPQVPELALLLPEPAHQNWK